MNPSPQRYLLLVAGPTAVGKTSLSISLAKALDTEIVSADSRQFYRDLLIGTARPTEEEMQGVPHHFVGHLSLEEELPAGKYETQVLSLLEQLFERKQVVILSGGSGLFLDAVCKGFDPLPEADPQIRTNLNQRFEQEGLSPLLEELKALDPDFYNTVDRNNQRRVLRALEVCLSTGKPYSKQRKAAAAERPFQVIWVALNRDREELYERINLRTDLMLAAGFEAEARKLHPHKALNALQTVGYRELFAHFEGEYDLDRARELIQQNTRRYAKRQLTWLRKNPTYRWFHPDDEEAILHHVQEQMQS